MRILIVNTSENVGGAAVAANRLMEALNNNGVKAKMLVMKKTTDHITVVGLPHAWLQRLHFLWERFVIYCHLHFSRHNLFAIDIANAGTDITSLREFKEADLIHLSWINQGMLSLANIKRIVRSGKPVVWTMHDLWTATGICHYARQCPSFRTGCHNCRLLPRGGGKEDLSRKVWNRKKALYHNANIHFITCSRWLEGQARQSALMKGQRITAIPNPIDTRLFVPTDKAEARLKNQLPTDRRIILFVAHRVDDDRKGANYFVEAVNRLADANPHFANNTCVAAIGRNSESIASLLHVPTYAVGFVTDERQMASVYAAADVFVLPSLEDNLPNTIMEATACGVPSVAFRVGGIPEMIDHKRTGYLANFKDSADLAEGIRWTLNDADREALASACLKKVAHNYSQQSVAMKYIEVYNELIALKRYII